MGEAGAWPGAVKANAEWFPARERALAQGMSEEDIMGGKNGLILMNDRPLNAETPAHLLDDDVTPYEHFFVRNNGLVPDTALDMNAEGCNLKIDGDVDTPLELTLADIK